MPPPKSRNPQWCMVPPELLAVISQNLPTLTDYLSFRAVCRSWRSAANHQLPRLILPSDPHTPSRAFFSFSTATLHTLPLPPGRDIIGSGHGYLILANPTTSILTLVHPFKPSNISLPPSGIPTLEIFRAFLTADPTHDCAVAVVTYGSPSIAICRRDSNGWSQWNLVHTSQSSWICDVAYYREKLYAIDANAVVTVYDVGALSATRLETTEMVRAESWCPLKYYLVESATELLMVVRIEYTRGQCAESLFKVFRLDECGEARWVGAGKIEDWAVFLCESRFGSIACGYLPGWYKVGCLYLVTCWNACGAGKLDVSILSLKDQNMRLVNHHRWEYQPHGDARPAWIKM